MNRRPELQKWQQCSSLSLYDGNKLSVRQRVWRFLSGISDLCLLEVTQTSLSRGSEDREQETVSQVWKSVKYEYITTAQDGMGVDTITWQRFSPGVELGSSPIWSQCGVGLLGDLKPRITYRVPPRGSTVLLSSHLPLLISSAGN